MPTLYADLHVMLLPLTDVMRKLTSYVTTIDLCTSATDTEH